MKRLNVNVLGMSEIKWKDEGDFWSGDYRIIFSGDKRSTTGVEIVLDKKWGGRVKSYMLFSDRIILIKLESAGEHIAIMQLYMPTSGYSDEDLEEVYEQIEEVLNYVKDNETLIILGDWNAVVGEGRDGEVIGEYGLGNRNERGQRLVDFCVEKNFVIANTIFKQPLRRRYTWTQPGDIARYQIDYIILRKKHKRYIQ
ncbi:craniofacial development protein 2-like [Nilaparvata lugens]|uniref:craniofacial development protein 2-like n=1 Tax=Nilaparvata lugens TaxID=108931 RepID=UPI00193CC3A3|nr:craniofacial development protein 2-like [Nilaparvata lugens]